jgi:hypothetical protein
MRNKQQETPPVEYEFLNLGADAWTNFENLRRVAADVRHKTLRESVACGTRGALARCIPEDFINRISEGDVSGGEINKVTYIVCDAAWIDNMWYFFGDYEILVTTRGATRVEENLQWHKGL